MEPLVRVCTRVGELRVGTDGARQDLEERDLADVRVGDGLEHERERLARRVAVHLGLTAGRLDDGRWPVDGRGTDLAHDAGQAVDADELGGRAADDREHARRGHALGERLLELLGGERLALEVALHQRVVGHDDALDQVVVDARLDLGHFLGDLGPGRRAAVVVEERLVGQQVGDAPEVALLADRQLEWRDAGAEVVAQLVERALERSPLAVELVDEDHARHAEVARDAPRRLGLHLDPLDGAHHEDREVGHPQGGVHVAHEVGVAGRVEDVDLVALVLEGGDRQRE